MLNEIHDYDKPEYNHQYDVIAEVIPYFSNSGVDVNIRSAIGGYNLSGHNLLMVAANKGLVGIVEALLNVTDIDVNLRDTHGDNALHLAAATTFSKVARSKKQEVIKLILGIKDIDVNAQNEDGGTALMYTVSRYPIEIVELMLNKPGIKVNLKTNERYSDSGWTALDYAIYNLNVEKNEESQNIVNLLKGE